jgi:hypothetical protein
MNASDSFSDRCNDFLNILAVIFLFKIMLVFTKTLDRNNGF